MLISLCPIHLVCLNTCQRMWYAPVTSSTRCMTAPKGAVITTKALTVPEHLATAQDLRIDCLCPCRLPRHTSDVTFHFLGYHTNPSLLVTVRGPRDPQWSQLR